MKVASDAIAGGEVELAEGTLETGSARLQVEDANVSAAKEAAFESEAEDAGYEIDSYLGISLDQVFYKGTGNSDDVWTNSMEDLENAATISLTLDGDLDGDDVAIIHNIHNGEEFEVIDAEYDADTKTVTFPADSFSDFAIATKKATIKDTTAPAKNAMSADLNNSVEELKKSVLTAADLKALEAGEDINIWLEVKDAAATVDATEKAKVEAAAQEASADYKIGAYLDIDLFKQVGTQKTQLTSTTGKLKITLTLPAALQGDYTYKIVQVHDGKATLLDATYDKTAHTLTFETDKFSTYAIIYKGTAKAAESTTATTATTAAATEAKTSPKTGDAAPITAVMIFALLGAAGMIVVGSKKRMMK